MQKGDILEAQASKYFHRECAAVLVSSLILRSKNLGQIDVAYLERDYKKSWVLRIVETKYSKYPSKFQMIRLRGTQDYLSRLLEMGTILEVKFCKKVDQTLDF
jgi:hypothetical protein